MTRDLPVEVDKYLKMQLKNSVTSMPPITGKHYDVLMIDDLGPTHLGGGLYETKIPSEALTAGFLNSYTGKFVMQDNKNYGYNSFEGSGLLSQTLDYANLFGKTLTMTVPSTPKTMTRLTTFEDWTILLEDNKLVAVNSSGNTVRAKGSLLSAGGRAWMYTGGKLWSGELERHETEQEIRIRAALDAEQKVYLSYQKKLDAIAAKESKLIDARDEALRNL